MKHLAILGASGHGKVVAEVAKECGWGQITFFDDAHPGKSTMGDWLIDGDTQALISRAAEFEGVHVAIGDNKIRASKFKELSSLNLVSLIHPAALISETAVINRGTAILGGVVVNSQVTVEQGSILNTGCNIDHDCHIGEFAHISPGVNLAGQVSIGDSSWIGIGTNIIQRVSVGSNVIVGAGSVVIKDLPDFTLAYGVPCKVINDL